MPDIAGLAAWTSNPDRAESALQRLVDRYPEAVEQLGDEGLGRLAIVAAVADPFVDGVGKHYRMCEVLIGDLSPRSPEQVQQGCREALTWDLPPAAALAVEQRAGLLRIAARDLLGAAATPEIAQELADLAQGVLSAAADHVCAEIGGRLAVIAMGKLGGRELNYVSDVDVLF